MISDSKRQFLIFLFTMFALFVAWITRIFIGDMILIDWIVFGFMAAAGSFLTYFLARRMKIKDAGISGNVGKEEKKEEGDEKAKSDNKEKEKKPDSKEAEDKKKGKKE